MFSWVRSRFQVPGPVLRRRSRSLSCCGPFEDATPTAGGFHSQGRNRGNSVELARRRGSTGCKAVVLPPLCSFFLAAVSRADSDLWSVQTEAFYATSEAFLEYSLTCFSVKPQALERASLWVGGLEAQPPV